MPIFGYWWESSIGFQASLCRLSSPRRRHRRGGLSNRSLSPPIRPLHECDALDFFWILRTCPVSQQEIFAAAFNAPAVPVAPSNAGSAARSNDKKKRQ